MNFKFNKPATASGLNLGELNGSLLLIKALRVQTDVATAMGPKDAVAADVHILDGKDAGKVYRDTLLFPKVLQGQLRSCVGTDEFTLGRLGQGLAKKGQNAPWVLADPTEADAKVAAEYAGTNAGDLEAAGGLVDDSPPPF